MLMLAMERCIMGYYWKIINGYLTLLGDNGYKFIPTAEQIYSSLHDNNEFFLPNELEKCPLPSSSGIKFSEFGKRISILVSKTKIDFEAIAKLVVEDENKFYDLPVVDNKIYDHIIIENTWYYLTANFYAIEESLALAGINLTNTIISLHQFFALKKASLITDIDIIDKYSDVLSKLKNIEISQQPLGLKGSLYGYQKKGVNWLEFMARAKCGCVLGDEMGLGKTLIIIFLISYISKNYKAKSLVIAPVSLLENWKREFSKFMPGIKVLVHYGSKRTGFYNKLLNYDVVITGYGTVLTDFSLFNMIKWYTVVLDEAQNIKNPYSQRARFIKALKYEMGIAVTGTPFENHMTDIWSIMNFSVPGLFGKLREFNERYEDDIESAIDIEKIISPLILRRKVAEVADELPEKVIVPQPIIMLEKEHIAYEQIRQEALNGLDNKKNLLGILTSLRMICTHPIVYNHINRGDPCKQSAKYTRLCEIIEEIVMNKEKVIIFTSYNAMFEIFLNDLSKRFSLDVLAINGSTSVNVRQPIIDKFSNIEGSAILVLNPHAAGTGLNITAANHVIHYNLEWNPAVEDQATARAYRRGQNKTVFVYRLFYLNTVEEFINDKLNNKREISNSAVIGNDGTAIDTDDIISAIKFTNVNDDSRENSI